MTIGIHDSLAAMRDRTVVSTLLATLFLLAPGTLGILQFGGALITQLDWIIFIVLALSVTVPAAVLNIFVFPFTFGSGELMLGRDGFFYDYVLSAIATGLALCAILFLSYFFVWTLALTCFVVFCIEVVLILVAVARWWKEILRYYWPR